MRYSDVIDFHERMDLPRPSAPQLMPREDLATRLVYMLEELGEFSKEHRDGNLASAADALADLVYFALGTAVQMGLPWNDVWSLVHKANMRKRPGLDKYGAQGAVKPEGWVSPNTDIALLLSAWGRPLAGTSYQELLDAASCHHTIAEILIWLHDPKKEQALREWATSGADAADIPEFCL